MKRLFALALMALSIAPAGAAPADPMLDRIVAGARGVSPASIAFERSARVIAQEGSAPAKTQTRTERWDGKALTLLTVDGKPATAAEAEAARKVAVRGPIAGYHRIADYLGGGARRTTDAAGRIVYRVEGLPKGSLIMGKDISDKVVAEATVDSSDAAPFVSHLKMTLAKPISFFMVAKIDRFEVANEYRPGPGGRPALVRQVQSLAGTQMGKAGSTRTESIYTPLR